jgi:hypothetical protein
MMQKTTKKNKIMHKSVISEIKLNSFFEGRSTLRSHRSKIIDVIPLNHTILLDCPRSEN